MIVVGVDGSEPSNRAVSWAAQEAYLHELPLKILHVTATPSDVVAMAATIARGVHSTLTVETEVRQGNPAKTLIEGSKTAFMVVVGNRGHGGFHDLLVGSTSLETAMLAHGPVAVIRKPSDREPNQDAVDRIVVGVDGAPHSDAALTFAFDEARKTGRELLALHAYQSDITAGAMGMPYVYDPVERHADAVQLLDQVVAKWSAQRADVDVVKVVVEMPTAAALVDHTRGAYLAVVGSRGLGKVAGALIGSVGHALVHHADCPAVIAHARSLR